MSDIHPSAEPGEDLRRYLDPVVLASINGFELRARLVVEGFYSGIHHSPHRGLSIEFADHRAYSQGDDLRHIDWKVFGRTDKYYIKEYEQETNLNLLIVLDRSESMAFQSSRAKLSKFDYAASLAAAIAYLALRQQDSVGLATFDQQLSEYVKPSNNTHQLKDIVRAMHKGTGDAKTDIGRILSELGDRLSQRTLVILISDLFDDPERTITGLKQLRYRRHEPVVWNVWDPTELTFPFNGPTLFEGLEEGGRLLAEPSSLRQRYLEEVQAFKGKMKTGCGEINVDYLAFDSMAPLDSALTNYLATRSARLRQRSSRVMA